MRRLRIVSLSSPRAGPPYFLRTQHHTVKLLMDGHGKSAKHVSKELVELGVTPAPLHPSNLARIAHRVAQA